MDDIADRIRQQAQTALEPHVAYHEAGHAMLAVLYGRNLTLVSVTKGQTVIDSKPLDDILAADEVAPEDSTYLLEDVRITMGGYLGEVVGLGAAHPNLGSDLTRMNAILQRIPNRRGQGMELQNQVQGVLEQHKDSLVRLAEALLVEKEVTGERARDLLRLQAVDRASG